MLYAKIFRSMYDGTMATLGWEAMVTFQQMLILSDYEGMVDVHPVIIARTSTIPLDIIERGIKLLEQPDPRSRNDSDDGRRIRRIADHRDWGWWIVNYKYYRDLQSTEALREGNRLRQQAYRDRKKVSPTNVDGMSQIGDSNESNESNESPTNNNSNDTKTKTKIKERTHARARATPLPDGFTISPKVRAWAKEQGYTNGDAHLEKFILYVQANGKRYVDWDAALMNAIRDNWAKIPPKQTLGN